MSKERKYNNKEMMWVHNTTNGLTHLIRKDRFNIYKQNYLDKIREATEQEIAEVEKQEKQLKNNPKDA